MLGKVKDCRLILAVFTLLLSWTHDPHRFTKLLYTTLNHVLVITLDYTTLLLMILHYINL